ncbi:helix-turn-helix domain-containing protein [Nitrospira sp. Nam80]
MLTVTAKELETLKIPKQYRPTVKGRLAVLRYASDYGVHAADDRFGLNRKTVRRWRRRWQTQDRWGWCRAIRPTDVDACQRRCYKS